MVYLLNASKAAKYRLQGSESNSYCLTTARLPVPPCPLPLAPKSPSSYCNKLQMWVRMVGISLTMPMMFEGYLGTHCSPIFHCFNQDTWM